MERSERSGSGLGRICEEEERLALAPTPPAVAASSLVLSTHDSKVFICSVGAELRHGQQIHLITSSGQIFTTAISQLSLEVNGGGARRSSSPGSSAADTLDDPVSGPLSRARSSSGIGGWGVGRGAPGPPLAKRSGSLSVCNGIAAATPQLTPEPARVGESSSSSSEAAAALFESTLFGRRLSEPAAQIPHPSLLGLSSAHHASHHSLGGGALPRGKLSSQLSSSSVKSPTGSSEEAEVSIDGINLEEIKEFAKTFKMKRLSLGLTQTQVGQALSMAEGPAYSQSAICRFEKLDITPKSAQKIKPVLERWMEEMDEKLRTGQFRPPQLDPTTSTAGPSLLLPTTTTAATPSTTSLVHQPISISTALHSTLTIPRYCRTTSRQSPPMELSPSLSPDVHSSPFGLGPAPQSSAAVSSAASLALMLAPPAGRCLGGSTPSLPQALGHEAAAAHLQRPTPGGSVGNLAQASAEAAGRKRKRRTSFTPGALDLLNQFFQRNTHPSGGEMTALAESLGYEREVVRVWFCNKRQALKNTIKKLKHQERLSPAAYLGAELAQSAPMGMGVDQTAQIGQSAQIGVTAQIGQTVQIQLDTTAHMGSSAPELGPLPPPMLPGVPSVRLSPTPPTTIA